MILSLTAKSYSDTMKSPKNWILSRVRLQEQYASKIIDIFKGNPILKISDSCKLVEFSLSDTKEIILKTERSCKTYYGNSKKENLYLFLVGEEAISVLSIIKNWIDEQADSFRLQANKLQEISKSISNGVPLTKKDSPPAIVIPERRRSDDFHR